MVRYKYFPVWVTVILLFMLTACQPQPGATPTPTRTPGPVDIQPAVTTPTVAAATQAPAAQPVSVGPNEYPPGINPLTGLMVDDPNVLQRRPLAIKVSNNQPSRPQSGLSFADLVFEHYAEGGETRFTALFYSQAPEHVGSIRSGRLIDLEIVPMFDAILATSGYSGGTLTRVESRPWNDRNLSAPFIGPPAIVRLDLPNTAVENTQFAVPLEIWNLATQRNLNQPPALAPGFAFNITPPAGGTPASHITFDYGLSWTKVDWQYDPAAGVYLRSLGGTPHVDKLTEQQLGFENVLAVGAMHVKADYVEDGFSGERSTEIQIWGTGPATLFRDGQRIEGTWTRNDPEQMLQFTDASGNVLTFKPGQTWVEFVPIGFDKMIVTP